MGREAGFLAIPFGFEPKTYSLEGCIKLLALLKGVEYSASTRLAAMTDNALTIRPTSTNPESYAVAYDHPDFGKIDVGGVAMRSGNPPGTDAWKWNIGWSTLPWRRWREGTAPTKKAAERAWKMAWPYFRDAIGEADWHDAKTEQDFSAKRIMIIDAKRLPGLTEAEHAQLHAELGRPGPAPHWLTEMLFRNG